MMGVRPCSSSFVIAGKASRHKKKEMQRPRNAQHGMDMPIIGYPDRGVPRRERQTPPLERQCSKRHCLNNSNRAVHHNPPFRLLFDHVGKQPGGRQWAKEQGFEKQGSTIRSAANNLDVGALGLDVAGLLALVADLLAGAGLLGAVAGQMARDTAVVALVAVDAVTCTCQTQYQNTGTKRAYGTCGQCHRKSSRSSGRSRRHHHRSRS
jgi:hypothetical protein